MAGVHLGQPSASFFSTPLANDPLTIPPPFYEPSLKCPFPIDATIYNGLLDVRWPIIVSILYFLMAVLLTRINKQNKHKPWWVSTTRPFYVFQILHNVFLAVYSFITFIAMTRAVYVSFPGWFGPHGLPGAVDALCKVHGPRGFGDAVSYDASAMKWGVTNTLIHLDPTGTGPDGTDIGRFWNEGLAFWGWWFYVSKMYEVVDTLIVLLKGKSATILQTYHHIGAMFCMWAGIRYMSAPILMFVLINAFIHSLMYTFYTVTTVGYRVPSSIKQVLTSMQIVQLIYGVTVAFLYTFIYYDVPVSKSYKIVSMLASPATASEAASDFLQDATQAARSTGQIPPWLKRLMYRAAGAEGLAESVRESAIYTDRRAAAARHSPSANEPFTSPNDNYSIRYSNHMEPVRCLDTVGQVAATWLNVAYLAPLLFLFIQFFIKSYLGKSGKPSDIKGRKGSVQGRRVSASADRRLSAGRRFSASASDAARAVSDFVDSSGTDSQSEEGLDDTIDEVLDVAQGTGKNAKQAAKKAKSAGNAALKNIKESNPLQTAKSAFNSIVKDVDESNLVEKAKSAFDSVVKDVDESNLDEKAKSALDSVVKDVDESNLVEKAKSAGNSAAKSAKESNVVKTARSITDSAAKNVQNSNLGEAVSPKSQDIKNSLSEVDVEDSFVQVGEQMREGLSTTSGAKDNGAASAAKASRTGAGNMATTTTTTTRTSSTTKDGDTPKTQTTSSTTTGNGKPLQAGDAGFMDRPTSRSSINEVYSVDYTGKISEGPGDKAAETWHPATYADAVKEEAPREDLPGAVAAQGKGGDHEDEADGYTSGSGGFGLND